MFQFQSINTTNFNGANEEEMDSIVKCKEEKKALLTLETMLGKYEENKCSHTRLLIQNLSNK